MLTPQEVAQRSFSKASFGGYNMSMVDDFLDELTKDYETLFNENALLKQKLKMLTGKVQEYQSTEEAMRKTLMMAQEAAEQMKKDAQAQCDRMLAEAEGRSATMQQALTRDLSGEEQKLAAARDSVKQFAAQVRKACATELEFLDKLESYSPEPQPAPAVSEARRVEEAVVDIQAAVERTMAQEDAETAARAQAEEASQPQEEQVEESSISLYEQLLAQRKAREAEAQEPPEDDTAPTRRVGKTLEFGKDYHID